MGFNSAFKGLNDVTQTNQGHNFYNIFRQIETQSY